MITMEHPELADDPVWQRFLSAPIDAEMSDEERRLWEEEDTLEGPPIEEFLAELARREGSAP